jgi:hypothetical protein
LVRSRGDLVGLAYFVSHGADLVRSGGEDGVDDAGGGCVGTGISDIGGAATALVDATQEAAATGDPSPLRVKTQAPSSSGSVACTDLVLHCSHKLQS